MKTTKIEVDDKVLALIMGFAKSAADTPNSILKALLSDRRNFSQNCLNNSNALDHFPLLPPGIPKALEQILETVYLVMDQNFSRNRATLVVAERHSIAKQTVIDKYCRQLGKTAPEIDFLLQPKNLQTLEGLLIDRFFIYASLIEDIFSLIRNNSKSRPETNKY